MKIHFENADDNLRKAHQLLIDKINHNLTSLSHEYADLIVSDMWQLYYIEGQFVGDITEKCTDPILGVKILDIVKDTISSTRF